MSYSLFCEKNNKPSEKQIAEVLGDKFWVWDKINSYLADTMKAKSSYKFYGKNYGWALGYSKSGKSIISLYPLANDFTFLVIVKRKDEIEITKTIDNRELLNKIKKTPEIHEGKWIFIKYSDIDSPEILMKIIDIKLKGLNK